MATYKKQLKDKDGNTIYPDVGVDLTNVVLSDDSSSEVPPTGWIFANDLGSNSVTSDKIVSNAVTSAKIASSAVTTDKLASSAVTTAKIAANAVTEAKIDMAGMPGLIAQGVISADGISNSFAIRNFSSAVVYDSRYASTNNATITLQPGCYVILMYSRWNDGTGSRYCGFTYDADTTDTTDRGSWCYSANRMTQEISRVLYLSSAKTLQLLFYSDTNSNPSSVNGSMFVIRLNIANK